MSLDATTEAVISLMPCKSYGETLTFYRALGFTVTHEQEDPYVYIAVKKGGIELHLSGSLGVYNAKNAFGACLVFVPAVETYHRAFADALRTQYGKVPTAGLPRMGRLWPEQTRFKLFDPTGNLFIFINQNEPETDYGETDAGLSELEKALVNAEFLRDTYANDQAAARVLDLALKRDEAASALDRARVLAARAELAVALGDTDAAHELQATLQQLPLSPAEREQYRHELEAAEKLAAWIVGTLSL